MRNRRAFLRTLLAAAAGACLGGRGAGRLEAALLQGRPARRRAALGGRPVQVIDAHAHCAIAVDEIVRGTPLAAHGGVSGESRLGPGRLRWLDRQGIDVQVLSVNGFWWYAADPGLARDIVRAQNEGLAMWVAAHPDRFVALASVALQHPELAAEQLADAVTRLGLRGAAIGGHARGEDLSLPRYDPFWARAAELGALVFVHPDGARNLVRPGALDGRGDLANVIGNPLETTYLLSRLIFDGTLDRFPGLRLCAAHAGGYLPSYLGRTEAACAVRREANCVNRRPPSDYLRSQIFVDTLVFSPEGLRHLAAELGASQLVFGTDAPFDWPVSIDLVLEAPFLDDGEKAAILGGNLRRLLRIA